MAVSLSTAKAYEGKRVAKRFADRYYLGRATEVWEHDEDGLVYIRINYEDGDREDVLPIEFHDIVLDEENMNKKFSGAVVKKDFILEGMERAFYGEMRKAWISSDGLCFRIEYEDGDLEDVLPNEFFTILLSIGEPDPEPEPKKFSARLRPAKQTPKPSPAKVPAYQKLLKIQMDKILKKRKM